MVVVNGPSGNHQLSNRNYLRIKDHWEYYETKSSESTISTKKI